MSAVPGLNTFIPLTVPAADGIGAATMVSGVVADKEIYVNGEIDGEYTVLGSQDGSRFAPLIKVQGKPGAPIQSVFRLRGTYQQFRVFRNAFGTSPTIGVASQATCACSDE